MEMMLLLVSQLHLRAHQLRLKETFKVENLKEYEKVSTSDLLTETPVTFAWLNGYGTVSIAKNSKNETLLWFWKWWTSKEFENGDKVTLKVNDALSILWNHLGKW